MLEFVIEEDNDYPQLKGEHGTKQQRAHWSFETLDTGAAANCVTRGLGGGTREYGKHRAELETQWEVYR